MKKANTSKSKPAAKPSDSSTTIAAGAAAAPLSAGPSGETQEPSDTTKTGSVPSAAAASTALVFSNRKTFWQPFLTATANPSAAAAAAGTPAAQNVPEGSSPAFDPPPLPNRKSFWQPYYSPPTAAGVPPVAAADCAPPAAVAEPEPPATAEAESPKETDSPMKEAPTVAEEVSAPTTSAAPPAAEAVPQPRPAAAEAASSLPPPSPAPPVVAFEPVPTLISDSPVYKDVAMTIERAKKSLAPFRKKVQDNVGGSARFRVCFVVLPPLLASPVRA